MAMITRALTFLRGLVHTTGWSALRQHPVEAARLLSARTPLSRRAGLGVSDSALSVPAPLVWQDLGRAGPAGTPWLVPRRWYGRDVIRRSLDRCLDCTTSWREAQSLVPGVLTGDGRGLTWAPWRRPKAGADQVTLAHTTRWRWFQEAARRATSPETVQDRSRGRFSGVLATDESWG